VIPRISHAAKADTAGETSVSDELLLELIASERRWVAAAATFAQVLNARQARSNVQ
jgi:hypothetical protein